LEINIESQYHKKVFVVIVFYSRWFL